MKGFMGLAYFQSLSMKGYYDDGNRATLSPLHLPSEETGGVALQGARCDPSCSGGRNHSERCVGCIVS